MTETRAAPPHAIPPHAIPARPPRDTRLDIVRGYLQLVIFASHAAGSFIGAWMIHAAWGFSDSSEQFVLLSGFTLGSVFALKSARQGPGAAWRDMWGRAARLYRTHLLVMALFFAMLVLTCHYVPALPMEAERLGWGYFIHAPLAALPGLFAMLYQPAFMGILPVFIWCMFALPVFAWAERRWADGALAASFALYLAGAYLGLAPPSLEPGGHIAFNPFAWQVLFLGGAWLGRRALYLGAALPRLAWLTWAAALYVAAALYLRLAWYGWLDLPVPFAETYWITGKDNLVLPRLLHALALAWLVAALIPRTAAWMEGAVPRFLAPIGRHSLQVFCLGLFLSWACTAVFRALPGQVWLDPILIGSGCLALGLYARALDRRREATRAVPVPA